MKETRTIAKKSKGETRRARRRVATALGVTGALLASPISVLAADRVPRAIAHQFPFVSLAGPHVANLNAVFTDTPDTADSPDITNPPDTSVCRVLLRLYDAAGQVVASRGATLGPGQVTQLSGEPARDAAIVGLRGEITTTTGDCAKQVIGTLEVIDGASGEVRAVVARAASIPAAGEILNDVPDGTPPPR